MIEQNENTRVSVNIVSWNSMAYLPQLFNALDQQTIGFRTIVVDNASNDGSPSWITSNWPFVTVLRNMRNQGFAKAHNQGIQMALSRWKDADLASCYIIVCNPDIELAPECLGDLIDFMDANPDIAACMPKLKRAYLRMTDTEHIKTERSDILDATGLVLTKARRAYDRGAGEADQGQYDQSQNIFGVCGAFSCFRASAVVSVANGQEFYDEDFFAYQEDIDIAYRLRRLGLKSAYVPGAVAWHHRRAPSTASNNWLRAFFVRFKKPSYINYFSTRNHTWFLIKHLSFSDILVHGIWILPYEIGKLIAAIFSLTSIKGYIEALRGLPKMLNKRKKYRQKERVTARDLRGELV